MALVVLPEIRIFFFDQEGLGRQKAVKVGDAPLLYVPGCAVVANPCPNNQRQAMRPDTKQLLGPNTAFEIGTVVLNTGGSPR
jgi:hypothetical protein